MYGSLEARFALEDKRAYPNGEIPEGDGNRVVRKGQRILCGIQEGWRILYDIYGKSEVQRRQS